MGDGPAPCAGSLGANTHASAPAAVRMRPRTLDAPRWVSLVAATTETPFFSVISPLLSRSLLLRLSSLTDDDVRRVLEDAIVDERGLAKEFTLDDDAAEHLVRLAGGDARRALTY